VKVYSVIVCYRPDVPQLLKLCENLLVDRAKVILVDNTDTPYLADQQRPADCQLITLGHNTGIAHAQNVGIAAAVTGGADVIAFIDQDSKIESGFLSGLVSALSVGVPDVVSPLHIDDTSHLELPSVRVNRYGVPRAIHRGDSSASYPVDVVISSGTAATKEVFQVAGTLDEGLFIDFVDTEWCLRCRSKQIPIRIVPSAVMHQRIGSKSIKFGMTTVLVHSHVRCYYQLRNCFHLFRKRHIPILFALREMISVFFSRALLLLIVGDKFTYTKAYLCALRDGMKGVTGSKPR
jgi:rhamnosyltransferase